MLAFNKTCLPRMVLTLQIWDKNCVGRFCKQLFIKVALLMVAILLNSIGLVLCLEIPECKVSYMATNRLPIHIKEPKDKLSHISSKTYKFLKLNLNN